ncbi:MAG: YicC/YloC family endoribonuclease [Rhodospirillaceae bacterium]
MPIQSMTGFARAEGALDAHTWVWELRSVNAKGLDSRFRPPYGFEALDPEVRKRVADKFKRGSITVNLTARRETGGGAYRINEAFLGEILDRLKRLKDEAPDAAPPRLDGILGLRGVIEPVEDAGVEETFDTVTAAMLKDLDKALAQLAHMRAEEGARLESVLNGQLTLITDLTVKAGATAAAQPDAIRRRLNDQVQALIADNAGLPEERLVQEAAVLITKADIREELDRLTAHVAAAGDLLGKTDGPIGRRFDFLCQEFNREANTLCSKSADTDLTNLGIELKTVIDQMREQVQNVE